MKNKYLIAHAIESPINTGFDIKNFSKELTSEISKKFQVKDVHSKIEPHITFKAPFFATEGQIYELFYKINPLVKEFIYNQNTLPLKKIRSFENRTVFWGSVNEREEQGFLDFTERLCDEMHNLPWMTFTEHDPLRVPHLTLATDLNEGIHDKIIFHSEERIRMLKNLIDVDSLSIYKFSDNEKRWEQVRIWK